jgi:hypothetical protein
MAFDLKPWNKGVSNEELLNDLRRVASGLGRSPRYEEFRKHSRFSSRLFDKRFGSWNEALKAAGLEVELRQNVSDEELFENLEKVWTVLGRQPRREEVRKPISLFSGGTYERRFGGWRPALERFVEYANGDSVSAPPCGNQATVTASARFPDLRMRWRVLTKDSFRCRSCGRSPALEAGVVLHVDHIIPWSKGGKTIDENLQTLCDRCNLGKSNLTSGDA